MKPPSTSTPYTDRLIYPPPANPVINMSGQFITQVRTIPITKRRLTKMGSRYVIQLPMSLNEIWSNWHENGAVINIIVELVAFQPKQKVIANERNINISNVGEK